MKNVSIEESNRNYWSKRTATQYAYKKIMNIDPDEIAKIEEEREQALNELTEGKGFMQSVEIISDAILFGWLPELPKVPEDKATEFYIEQASFDRYIKQNKL